MSAFTCPHCQRPAPESSAQCPHCGGSLRVIQARQPHAPVRCAGCGARCDPLWLDTLQLDACVRCQGLWFDVGELKRFRDQARDPQLLMEMVQRLHALPSGVPQLDKPGYLPCPVCDTRMTPTHYSGSTSLMLHSCRDHGSWIDREGVMRLLTLLPAEDPSELGAARPATPSTPAPKPRSPRAVPAGGTLWDDARGNWGATVDVGDLVEFVWAVLEGTFRR